MVSRFVKGVRCKDVLDLFMQSSNGHCVFFTLTTKDVVDLEEIRKRWRGLRHYLQEVFPAGSLYVMNFERHPGGHGWHIHSVWNHYIDLRKLLHKIQSFGFGRLDVRRVNSQGVSDYLTKHALKAYRGVKCDLIRNGKRLRLVNCSRGLPVLSDYKWQSDFKRKTKSIVNLCEGLPFFRSMTFGDKWKYCELVNLLNLPISPDTFKNIITGESKPIASALVPLIFGPISQGDSQSPIPNATKIA